MNSVSLTIPPIFGADIASWIVLRCMIEMRLRAISANAAPTVMTPRPPIWIITSIIACPNPDQYEAVSLTTSPVTHTAEVEVNTA